nr:MAG TPA: hypothetical protein [Caudoviricetes sp.]
MEDIFWKHIEYSERRFLQTSFDSMEIKLKNSLNNFTQNK